MFYFSSRRALARCVSALAIFLSAGVLAADDFAVSAAQMQALGVQLQRLEKPAAIAGMMYPARVVLPPSQEYVVNVEDTRHRTCRHLT